MARGWTRQRWWRLLEPGADDPRVARLLDQLLDLSNGVEPAGAHLDLDAPGSIQLLERHRVIPLVPIELVAGRHRARIAQRQLEIRAAALRLHHDASWAIETLERAGVATRVLKGLATAELDHRDPRHRHAGDVDLAVASGDLDAAIEVLRTAGCTELPTPFDPVLWYGRTAVTPGGFEIDLHSRLFRRSPLDRSLLDDPGEPLGSLPSTALSPERRLVHAAGHFMISPPGTRRMNGFCDIGRLLERPDLDLHLARRFASQLHVERLVGAGIRTEAELSDRRGVLRALDTWRPPDWLERRTRLVPHRRLVLDHLGRYREVPPGHRLAYLPAWLLPSARQRKMLRASAASAASRAVERARLPRRSAA